MFRTWLRRPSESAFWLSPSQLFDSEKKFIFPARISVPSAAQEHRLSAAFRGGLGSVYSCEDMGEMAFGAPRFKRGGKNYFRRHNR
jgi:hypothetical protein